MGYVIVIFLEGFTDKTADSKFWKVYRILFVISFIHFQVFILKIVLKKKKKRIVIASVAVLIHFSYVLFVLAYVLSPALFSFQ